MCASCINHAYSSQQLHTAWWVYVRQDPHQSPKAKRISRYFLWFGHPEIGMISLQKGWSCIFILDTEYNARWSFWPKSCLSKVDCWMSGLKFWLQKNSRILRHIKMRIFKEKIPGKLLTAWIPTPASISSVLGPPNPREVRCDKNSAPRFVSGAKLRFQKRSTWRDVKIYNPHWKIISTQRPPKINIGTKDSAFWKISHLRFRI